MKVLLQRVKAANVTVDNQVTGEIERGLLVFLGVGKGDTARDADYLADKIAGLRLFPDLSGKMNWNVKEISGGVLIISQFTLYADCRRGRRPSFDLAAPPAQAECLYIHFVEAVKQRLPQVRTGVFQAAMEVRLVNDGPVTIMMDSDRL